jgi:hypothetical protein
MNDHPEERTPADILNAEPIQVILGGKTYGLLPIKKRYFRKFAEQISRMLGSIAIVQSLLDSMEERGGSVVAVIDLIPIAKEICAAIGPDVLDLIYFYNPELEADRERIEDEASLDECVEALHQCFKVSSAPFAKFRPIISPIIERMKKSFLMSDSAMPEPPDSSQTTAELTGEQL